MPSRSFVGAFFGASSPCHHCTPRTAGSLTPAAAAAAFPPITPLQKHDDYDYDFVFDFDYVYDYDYDLVGSAWGLLSFAWGLLSFAWGLLNFAWGLLDSAFIWFPVLFGMDKKANFGLSGSLGYTLCRGRIHPARSALQICTNSP